ncbi:hypothetical protein [Paenibacillus sp. A3M_27_13]|uniref:hypothetical protein n=1 Tax=Paenibacillus sp. A3M_27_13 TaxID=2962029 RepID=UPI0020B8590A|nr:hypothetical protein [Paenibacillus sp. A3M_27_13]MCP3746707.1 hypothetical protein [Paenibacillus sp. A3M_27_13]
MGRNLAGRVVWFVRPRKEEDRTRRFCRLAVGNGCNPAQDLFWHRGNVAGAALFCPGSHPDLVVQARIRTVHWADDHVVSESVFVFKESASRSLPASWVFTSLYSNFNPRST